MGTKAIGRLQYLKSYPHPMPQGSCREIAVCPEGG